MTFLALQDQQSLLATTSSRSLGSMRACQISTSTLTTSLSRAGSAVHLLVQASGPLMDMRPNSLSHACRLALGCLVCLPSMPALWSSVQDYSACVPLLVSAGTRGLTTQEGSHASINQMLQPFCPFLCQCTAASVTLHGTGSPYEVSRARPCSA